MRNRKEILKDLILFKKNIEELENELLQYPWDSEEPVIIIKKSDFINIFKMYIKNEISPNDLENWANSIECRDDLHFEIERMQEIIFELANPEINGEITKDKIDEIIKELS